MQQLLYYSLSCWFCICFSFCSFALLSLFFLDTPLLYSHFYLFFCTIDASPHCVVINQGHLSLLLSLFCFCYRIFLHYSCHVLPLSTSIFWQHYSELSITHNLFSDIFPIDCYCRFLSFVSCNSTFTFNFLVPLLGLFIT